MSAMFVPPSLFSVISRRLAASVLVLWLAGVGCIIGCEMNVAAAHHNRESQTASEGEESCAMSSSAGHDCCKKEEDDDAAVGDAATNVRNPQTPASASCCPLAKVSADPARKISSKDVPLAIAGSGLPVAPESRTSTTLPSSRLRVPDRGSTYLRCCVFLI